MFSEQDKTKVEQKEWRGWGGHPHRAGEEDAQHRRSEKPRAAPAGPASRSGCCSFRCLEKAAMGFSGGAEVVEGKNGPPTQPGAGALCPDIVYTQSMTIVNILHPVNDTCNWQKGIRSKSHPANFCWVHWPCLHLSLTRCLHLSLTFPKRTHQHLSETTFLYICHWLTLHSSLIICLHLSFTILTFVIDHISTFVIDCP